MDTSETPRQLIPEEWQEWQRIIAAANRNNILHHCRACDREWVTSHEETCTCGSTQIERVACWQFPDD